MKRIVVAMTGATGVIAGVRLLESLQQRAIVDLVISEGACRVLTAETGRSAADLANLAAACYGNDELDAPIASGSHLTDGMVVAPCSMKSLSGIANSYADTLVVRAADVHLKQRRPLLLAPRETPLHAGHLRLLAQAAGDGATIVPFMPAFYQRPATIDDLLSQWVGLVLDLLGLPHDLSRRYSGPPGRVAQKAKIGGETTRPLSAC